MKPTAPSKQIVNIRPKCIDNDYLALCQYILDHGVLTENRTGVKTYSTTGLSIRHNMEHGFPILTTKKIAWNTLKVELEGFIKGITSKKWYQERGCRIWDEWCSPLKVPYGHDEETKRKMKEEDDLGPIYGKIWNDFNGINQIEQIINSLKNNPTDRRMICTAWKPDVLDQQALPPCHMMWGVNVIGDKLCLDWVQRSCDFPLGIPVNIGSYGLLLHLLAQLTGYKEGILTGHFMNCHIYENQIEGITEQMNREPFPPCRIETEPFDSIYDWDHTKTKLIGYQSHPVIKMEVAV
jgi:thymidylate synthase